MTRKLVLEHSTDDAGDRLFRIWKPDGLTVGGGGDARLRKWMQTNGIDASTYSFIRGKAFAKHRKRAMAHLEAKGKK